MKFKIKKSFKGTVKASHMNFLKPDSRKVPILNHSEVPMNYFSSGKVCINKVT
jgi:hypothetical protein